MTKDDVLVESKRLIITRFTPDMAQLVHENSLDDDTRRFLSDEVFETVEDARNAIDFLISQYGNFEGPQVFPLITKEENQNIGYVQLVPLGDGKWEIGYHIAKRFTGRGYATEAVKAFLPVMAKAAGIQEVYGICISENIASKRVLEKCGFEKVYEGLGDYKGERHEIYKGLWKGKTQA